MKKRNFNWKPTWLTAIVGVAIGAVIAGAVVFAPLPAQAVHNGGYGNFEIDGNPTDSAQPVGDAMNMPDDWDTVFNINNSGTADQPVYQSPRETAETGDQEAFIYDDGGNNTVDYGFSGQSNKDIDKVGTWLYDNARVTPDKDNITHAYAKAYSVQVGGVGANHLVIDFGADRLSNNGDAALGFWFFQENVARGPANRRGVGAFEGEHVDGDILVQVDFVQGGTKANKIQIFSWRSDGLGTHGTLDQIAYEEGTGNTVCTDDDAACARTNSEAWPSPWAYDPKSGPDDIFGVQSFFEGAVDITALIGHDLCFSSFMAETRTSHSETAELKDFAVGAFELCSVDLVRKVCEARSRTINDVVTKVSPVYLPSTNTYQTEHDITIRNDGFGTIFDVALQDNAVTSTNAASTTGSSCKIIAITGGVDPVDPGSSGIQMPVPVLSDNSGPNPNFTNDGWIPVADALSNASGQNTMTVTVQCVSQYNPFVNSATVRGAPLSGLPATISDFYAEVDTPEEDGPPSDVRNHCVVSLKTGLTLTKSCPDPVVFELVSGVYKPKVCVDISLKNDGESILDVTLFKDDHNDGTSSALLSNTSLTNMSIGGDGQRELQPGATATVKDCYYPAIPDGSPPILDPDTVTYGDTAKASGKPHHAPTTTVTASDKSATCPLCPIGLNGT